MVHPAKAVIIAFSALFAVTASALAQQAKASQLGIRLSSDKAVYSLHGNIHLEIVRENTGGDTMIVPRQWGWGIGRTEVHVYDAAGKEVQTDFMPDELPPPPRPYDFVVLSPGDFIGTRVEEPAAHFVNKPGDYEVVVAYRGYLSESYAREVLKMPDRPFWSRERGYVLSNRIKLHVVE